GCTRATSAPLAQEIRHICSWTVRAARQTRAIRAGLSVVRSEGATARRAGPGKFRRAAFGTRGRILSVNAVARELPIKRVSRDSERSCHHAHVPARGSQGSEDALALLALVLLAGSTARDPERGRRQIEIRGRNAPPIRQHERPSQRVLELANVAGERVQGERAQRVGRELRRGPALPLRDPREQGASELGQILEALAERWQAHDHDGDSVEEILAEPTARDV